MFRPAVLLIPILFFGLVSAGHASAPSTFSADQFDLVFEPQGLGSASGQLTVNLANSGTTPVDGVSLKIVGPNAADFTFVNGCAANIAPVTYCPVQVKFTPNANGLRIATLLVSSAAASLKISLQGSGTSAASLLSVFPAALQFSAALGAGPSIVSAQVTNASSFPVTINSGQFIGAAVGDFGLPPWDGACSGGQTLPPNASCTLYIAFQPNVLGTRMATFVINTSVGNVNLPLTGMASSSSSKLSLSSASALF